MPLTPGQSLGPYRIIGKIGEGGMGEVWRGMDTALDRQVAIKILPAALGEDAERLARFAREAKVLASLTHPNIAAIYGLHEHEATRFIVMELVEGEDLAERLAGGPLPLDEVLDITGQIAAALDAAHEQGIIHRDLKPANIRVTSDGSVKVLDFGLAKAMDSGSGSASASASMSPTITVGTMAGTILGTAAYMSPEQARGRPVDRRADMWALGCVLWEMLTGTSIFRGETVSDTLAEVLKSEPSWDRLPSGTPPAVKRLLRRCLQKDPKRRLTSAADALLEIRDARDGEVDTAAPDARSSAGWRPPVPLWIALLLVVAGLGWWMGRGATPDVAPKPVSRFSIELGSVQTQERRAPALSPDGRSIVFVRDDRLWIRRLDALEPRPLEGTEGAIYPFWSPDSASVAYFTNDRLWRVAVDTGKVDSILTLLGEMIHGAGGCWTPDDRIIYSRGNTELFEVPARGGEHRVLLSPRLPGDAVSQVSEGPDGSGSDRHFHGPSLLPGGRGLIYAAHRQEGADTIEALVDSRRTVLLRVPGQRLDYPVYSSSGHILFQRGPGEPGLWAVPFSLEEMATVGEPFPVVVNGGHPSISRDGALLYTPDTTAGLFQFVWVDRSGVPIETVGEPVVDFQSPRLSPDERFVVVERRNRENYDIYVVELERARWTRLTFEDGAFWDPTWVPDGRSVIYQEDGSGLMMRSIDGMGEPRHLGPGNRPEVSPDGRYVVFNLDHDIAYAPLDGSAKPVVIVSTHNLTGYPAISPDGSLLAYTSEETGRREIFLTRFPMGGGKWQVSTEGGAFPHWNGDGSRLYYELTGSVYEVAIESTPTISVGIPHELFYSDWVTHDWDVSNDGERFLLIKDHSPEGVGRSVVIVESWATEFAAAGS